MNVITKVKFKGEVQDVDKGTNLLIEQYNEGEKVVWVSNWTINADIAFPMPIDFIINFCKSKDI